MKYFSHYIFFFLLVCFQLSVQAQSGLSYGFKAGLSSNTLRGPLDEGERFVGNVGFHLGIIVKYPITDIFGIKGEFVYSQKGTKYFYNGPSQFYVQQASNPFIMQGTRDLNLNVANDYLDFPIMAYATIGRFEFSAGVNLGLLVGSTGGGQLKITGTDPVSEPFTLNLDHRYYGDKAREALPISNTIVVDVSGQQIVLPTLLGAYYEYETKDASLYKFLDVGVNGGFSIFLNEGLYLGFRVNFGLTDVTHGDADISFRSFEGNAPILQNDKDKQTSYQFSLGFSF